MDLLNSMDEFRAPDSNNVEDIMEYMDEEGYADMRSNPDHALAILHFAENFHFDDMYTDAYSHCVGMHHKLQDSSEFEVSVASKY